MLNSFVVAGAETVNHLGCDFFLTPFPIKINKWSEKLTFPMDYMNTCRLKLMAHLIKLDQLQN